MIRNLISGICLTVVLFAAQALRAQNLASVSVIRPTTATMNCAVTPRQDSVEVRISNVGASSVSNFSISYQLNNGTVVTETYAGTLANGASFNYTFSTALVTQNGGTSELKIFTSLPTDSDRNNDTIRFNYVPRVSSFPYYESFESNNGGFTSGGTNATWVWGARNKPNTGQAADGTRCWTNGGLTGYYSNSDASFLRSPCYDFSNLTNPYIAFQFLVEVEYNYEVVTMQYSLNGGTTWTNLGGSNEPDNCETKNWFNHGLPGWSGNARSYPCSFGWGGGCGSRSYCGGWAEARRCLSQLAGQPNVMFQWMFTSSGTQCTAEGFALDSLVIGDAPQLTPLDMSFQNNVCPGVPVQFTSNISNCYSNPRWDFGDSTGILTTASGFHAFRKSGTYDVKLIVNGLCGSIDTLIKQITIKPSPAISIDPFGEKLCQTGSTVNLQATPAGGTFFVNNTPQNTIDPAALGLGKQYVRYSYTDPTPGGCAIDDTVFFEVYLPVADIRNLGGQYCPSAPDFVLQGTPAGGVFFINGTRDSLFSATGLGLGTHTVLYTYQDSIGCPASVSRLVDINNSLVVDMNPLQSRFCPSDAPVVLQGTPTGGIFRINGTVAGSYDPMALATTSGPDTIIYFYTDGFCSSADTQIVDVVTNTAAIQGLNPLYCYNAGAVTLQATPAGGSFTLNGTTVFSLNPASLTPGQYRVMYMYQDPTYGCLDSAVALVTIDKPAASIDNLLPHYCIDAAAVNLQATPTGGNFTLNGSAATSFDPATLGLGSNRVIYQYTNANNCTVRDTHDFQVVDLPALQFVGLNKTLCFNSNAVPINTNPTGGILSINGFPASRNEFDPSLYPSGQYHTIEYQFVDFIYGCVNSISDSIYIGVPPAVSISQLNGSYCQTDQVVNLTGTPSGGQFTVNGTIQNTFNPAGLGAGTHEVKYRYQDANGCENEITQWVDVTNNPGDTITPGPRIEICLGEEVELQVNGSLPGTWSTNETSNSIQVKPTVTTNYWYRVDACLNYYDSVTVVVHANPVAEFDVDPSEGFAPLEVTAKSRLSTGRVDRWVFDTTTYTTDPATHFFSTPGPMNITLYVVDSNGCRDSLQKQITVFDGLTIPNVFTPNNDGANDNFGPITRGSFSDYNFRIYDRWGVLLFESSSPLQRWDGTHNGQAVPEGTYFYLLLARNIREFKLEGTVNLIR